MFLGKFRDTRRTVAEKHGVTDMAKLSLTLPFQPNETLPSYCSRIAAVNGIESASEF